MAKRQRTRRYFSPEFKAETIELIRSSGRSIPDVCRELDLTETTVRNWMRQARIDAGEEEGLSTDEREELRRLRSENKTLRMERDLLKKAAAFFAKDSDPTR
jgi:transposase